MECKGPSSPFIATLPSESVFSDYVTKLGIGNDHRVVVYDHIADPLPTFSSGRVWWMFRTFGHTNVSVLDGGLKKWISDGYSTMSGPYSEEEENMPSQYFR